jgi:multiple sugar transport system permease protein
MIMLSFKSQLDIIAVPPKFIFSPVIDNWLVLFGGVEANPVYGGVQMQKIFFTLLPNSLISSTISSAITVIVATLAGYSLSRFHFKGRRQITFAIISTRMLPPIATAIPLYIFFSDIGLRDTLFGLILAYTAINIPFAIWMMASFIMQTPVEIEEAALVDGCRRIEALLKVVLPILKPGIAATFIFNYILAWNDFALAFFLAPNRAATMPLYILSFVTETGTAWGPMAAYGVIYIIPSIIFIVFAQNYLVKGFTLGAVKG